MLCVLAWPGCVFSVSGPDLDRLILGNYIAVEQPRMLRRAGMRLIWAPRGGAAVSSVMSLPPKNFMGLLCWFLLLAPVKANERRLLAQAHVVR